MSNLSLDDAREFTEDMYELDPSDCLDEFEHDKMLEIYQSHPSLCQEELSDDSLPLHHILQYKPSLELVKCVYDAYPEAIQETDGIEYTPLHMACLYKCSLEVVKFIAKANPEACKMVSSYGGAPIDLAKKHLDDDYRDVVRALKKLRPQVRFDKDTKGTEEEEEMFKQLEL